MRSGDLNRRVTIQSRSASKDAAGQRLATWSDVVSVNAKIQPLTGRELELAQAINAEVTYQFEMRYRTNLTTANRLVYQGRHFNVLSVIDVDTKHQVLQVMCSQGLNDE